MASNKKTKTKRTTKTSQSSKSKKKTTQKYNPKMAKKIARTKDVDAKTRRVNNAAARTSRTKAKDNIYSEERKVFNLMKEKNRLLDELTTAMIAYAKNSERLPPKKKITDPYLEMVLSRRFPMIRLPLSKKDTRKAKEVEEVLKDLNMTMQEVVALFQIKDSKSEEKEANNNESGGVEHSVTCAHPTSSVTIPQSESREIVQTMKKPECVFLPFYNAKPEDY